MAIKFSGNARHKMTTTNNILANLATYGYIWLLYMVVLLVTPGGGLHMKGVRMLVGNFELNP